MQNILNKLKRVTGKMNVLGQRRYTGYVDKWFPNKGFGFATLNDESVFLHISKIYEWDTGEIKIKEGSKIEAFIINAVKGRQAVDIEVVKY